MAARLFGGGSDLSAPLVNGFVNETPHDCPYRMERGVMAWTPD